MSAFGALGVRGAGFGAPGLTAWKPYAPEADRELRGQCATSGQSVVIHQIRM
jgi:hypothetical protein